MGPPDVSPKVLALRLNGESRQDPDKEKEDSYVKIKTVYY